MNDKGQPLNFDFDDVPVRPNTDRPAYTAIPNANATPAKPLSASEVMGMGKSQQVSAPKAENGPSHAAKQLLLKMRQTEQVREHKTPTTTTPKQLSFGAQPKTENESATVEAEVDTVTATRQIMVETFTLDTQAVQAGFDRLDVVDEPTVAMPVVENIAPDLPDDGSTKMFTAPADGVMDKIKLLYKDTDDKDEDEDEQVTFDEYNSVADAQSVTEDLTRRKRRLTARSIATSVVAILLIIIAFSENLFPFGHSAYFIALAVLLGLTALINLPTLQSLISVFTLKADVDFAPSFALLAAMLQTVAAAAFGVDGITASSMFAAAAAVTMAFNTISKRATVKRTLANFELIANEEPKQAGAFIEPPVSGSIADPNKLGESLILGRRTTIDLKGFIANSLSADLYEKQSGRLSLIIVIAAIIACVVTALKQGSITAATTAFAAVGCSGAQIAALYPSAVLLSRACSKLRVNSVMLSGFKAAEQISDANVVVLDSDELFRDDDVHLYKFRTFDNISPDDAFMTAAALTIEGHSPLAGMFAQIALTNGSGMFPADSVIYEDGMGLTGWVNERKTLLGNRMIMESHSIPVPPIEVDKKIINGGHFPLYLAIDDKPAAMFIIGYTADKQMLHRVRRLINTGVTVLVRTVDPNVTADLICSNYGLPTGTVEVMTADASRVYCDHMSPTENEPAIFCAPNAKGFTDAYIASFNLHRSANVAAITAIVLTCIAVTLCFVLPILNLGWMVNISTILASYVVCGVITAMAALINS